MSQFVPEAFQNTTPAVAPPPSASASGTLGSYISKFLADPISNLPPEFTKWLEDFQALNIPQIPISQIVGFTQFVGKFDRVVTATAQNAGASYGDLATSGPVLTGLQDGTYFFLYAAQVSNDTVGHAALLNISLNGATPLSADLASASSGYAIGFTTASLANDNNNTAQLKYASDGGGTASYNRRALFGLKLANT